MQVLSVVGFVVVEGNLFLHQVTLTQNFLKLL